MFQQEIDLLKVALVLYCYVCFFELFLCQVHNSFKTAYFGHKVLG